MKEERKKKKKEKENKNDNKIEIFKLVLSSLLKVSGTLEVALGKGVCKLLELLCFVSLGAAPINRPHRYPKKYTTVVGAPPR